MIVYLRLATWAGITPGAQHHYGYLEPSGSLSDIKLVKPLTVADARRLNRQSRAAGFRGRFKPGSPTGKFNSREAVIAFAIERWRDLLPDHQHLVLGDRSAAEPCPLLDSRSAETEELRAEVDSLVRRYHHAAGWREKLSIYNRWAQLLGGQQYEE